MSGDTIYYLFMFTAVLALFWRLVRGEQ